MNNKSIDEETRRQKNLFSSIDGITYVYTHLPSDVIRRLNESRTDLEDDRLFGNQKIFLARIVKMAKDGLLKPFSLEDLRGKLSIHNRDESAALRALREKGFITTEKVGKKTLYNPTFDVPIRKHEDEEEIKSMCEEAAVGTENVPSDEVENGFRILLAALDKRYEAYESKIESLEDENKALKVKISALEIENEKNLVMVNDLTKKLNSGTDSIGEKSIPKISLAERLFGRRKKTIETDGSFTSLEKVHSV